MIHGHTHRPAVHELTANGSPAKRIVLGDWDKNVWWLEAEPGKEPELFKEPL
jgi:UDP-2,3-diacylglucosamine hydrolase